MRSIVFLTFLFSMAVGMSTARALEPGVEDFALFDQSGHLTQLYRQSLAKGVVLISYGIGCPIARKNLPALEKLRESYEQRGIRLFLVDAAPQDTRPKLAKEAGEFGIKIPILADETQEISRSLGFTRTAEALLLSPSDWKILYRGPIDSSQGYGIDRQEGAQNYLKDAIDQWLAGKVPERRDIRSLGCAIQYEPPRRSATYEAVAAVIGKKCASCHEAGGIPPTNLWTYEELAGWGKMLREVLRTERMPPWEVDPQSAKVTNDPALTRDEKKLIYDWVERGFPAGKGTHSLSAPRPEMVKIRVDLRFPMKAELTLEADARAPWHYEELISGAPEDIWISGYDFEVSNRSIVQHATLLVMKQPLDLSQNLFEVENFKPKEIYSYMRWSAQQGHAVKLRPGLAYKIPKGSFVYLELHFVRSGKKEKELVTVDLQRYRSKMPPRELTYWEVDPGKVSIPPNTESFWVKHTAPVTQDLYLVSAGPHMHWHGQSAKLSLLGQDGKSRLLLSTRFIFKNRKIYKFSEPIFLKAGSWLVAEFEFDNSKANPAPIHPEKEVHQGPDAFENEMADMHVVTYKATRGSERLTRSSTKRCRTP